MKKVILIVSALVLVVSGVAAVSAYEAHVVNVTAHVENALDTPSGLVIGGSAAFPEEWLEGEIIVTSSTSFKNQPEPLRVTDIDFKVCAKPKPRESVPGGGNYTWAGGFTFVSTDAGVNWLWIGPANDEVDPVAPFCPDPNLTGTVTDSVDETLVVGMDMPVFAAYYVPETDVEKPRPAGADCGVLADEPCVVSDGDPTGTDFGLDLIIQVTNIYKP